MNKFQLYRRSGFSLKLSLEPRTLIKKNRQDYEVHSVCTSREADNLPLVDRVVQITGRQKTGKKIYSDGKRHIKYVFRGGDATQRERILFSPVFVLGVSEQPFRRQNSPSSTSRQSVAFHSSFPCLRHLNPTLFFPFPPLLFCALKFSRSRSLLLSLSLARTHACGYCIECWAEECFRESDSFQRY